MDANIHSVKAKSQAGDIKILYNENTKRQKLQDIQLWISKTYAGEISGIFSRGPWVQKRALLGLHICL